MYLKQKRLKELIGILALRKIILNTVNKCMFETEMSIAAEYLPLPRRDGK
jgi:hypothetical protein